MRFEFGSGSILRLRPADSQLPLPQALSYFSARHYLFIAALYCRFSPLQHYYFYSCLAYRCSLPYVMIPFPRGIYCKGGNLYRLLCCFSFYATCSSVIFSLTLSLSLTNHTNLGSGICRVLSTSWNAIYSILLRLIMFPIRSSTLKDPTKFATLF